MQVEAYQNQKRIILHIKGHRWLAALSVYDFDIQYHPGKSNADADGLSRLQSNQEETISKESVKAICGMIRTTIVETLSLSPEYHQKQD